MMSHIQPIVPETTQPASTSTPPRRRRALLAWTSVVALLALGAGAYHYDLVALPSRSPAVAAAPAAPAAVPVSVAAVTRQDATLWTEFSGRVEAVGRVEIRPRVAGAIVGVAFREGSLIHKGEVLFTIDPAPYAAEVQRAESQVTTAQAQLVLAVKEQSRAQQLVATNAVPLRDLDQRVSTLSTAEASLRAAQAQLVIARLDLGWTEVRAPIDGRVGRIEVTPGNLVPAGPTAPVLTTLVSVSPAYASFEADEQTVERAVASLPPGAEIGSIPVQLGTLAVTGTPVQGRLQFIDNVVDARSGTIRVRATFDNKDGKLTPGQFARMRLGQPKTQPVIAVAERAIGTDQDRRYVLVVGADSKATYRQVQLGGMSDGLRIVTSGLEDGERIVVNGLQRIRPGATVAPQLVAMQAPTELANR